EVAHSSFATPGSDGVRRPKPIFGRRPSSSSSSISSFFVPLCLCVSTSGTRMRRRAWHADAPREWHTHAPREWHTHAPRAWHADAPRECHADASLLAACPRRGLLRGGFPRRSRFRRRRRLHGALRPRAGGLAGL